MFVSNIMNIYLKAHEARLFVVVTDTSSANETKKRINPTLSRHPQGGATGVGVCRYQ